MPHPDDLHDRAMKKAEDAEQARQQGDHRLAQALFREAYAVDLQAAQEVDVEPLRSSLYLSVASLALEGGLLDQALAHAQTGLSGKPPADVQQKLQALITDINKRQAENDKAASTRRTVVDISDAWLAEAEMKAALEEIQRLAAESAQFIPPDFSKTASELRQRAEMKTNELLKFVAGNPSIQEIQHRLDDIFETIQFATGIPSLIAPVLAILEVLIRPLEQLGAWARLEPWFMQMFPALVSGAPKDISRWRRLMIQHSLYTGLRTRLDNTIDDLLEGDQSYPHEHMLLMLLRSTTTDEEHNLISGELLDIANLTHDYRLMMQVHTYKAHRYLENFQLEPAFAQAQQAFILASKLRDERHLALGAWYMASVFHQHNGLPAKALFYLDLARRYVEAMHDQQWMTQIQALRAFSYHALKRNQEAVAELETVLPRLDPHGLFYARALYVWCAAMSFLNPTADQFAEIEGKLMTALGIYEQQRSYADVLSAHMALVQIYLDQGKREQARQYFEDVLQPVGETHGEAVSSLHQTYIDALKRQLGIDG